MTRAISVAELAVAHVIQFRGVRYRARLRLRGPNGAHDEFLPAATAQKLRRMAKWLCPAEPETANLAT